MPTLFSICAQQRRRGGFTPFDVGINFRATSGYVTDGVNETYANNAYPETRGGATFGWIDGAPNYRDRGSAADRRVAGMHFTTDPASFRVDVPPGIYTVWMGFADATQSRPFGGSFADDTTERFTVSGTTASGTSVGDANSNIKTLAEWEVDAGVPRTNVDISSGKAIWTNAAGSVVVISHIRLLRTS